MRISVFYDHIMEACSQTSLPEQSVMDKVRSFGISALECSYEYLKDRLQDRKNFFAGCGMAVSCIYATVDFTNCRDASFSYHLADAAAFLGADKILVIPGFVSIDGMTPAAAVQTVGQKEAVSMASCLNDLCGYAKSLGVRVVMEDFDDAHAPFSSARQLLWFIGNVPQLYVCFDTGNFIYAGDNELEAFELLKHRIGHVHLKDRSLAPAAGNEPMFTVTGKELYPASVGSGCIHIKEIVDMLLDMGYDDTFAIEHFGATDQLSCMRQSAAWLSGVIQGRMI